MSPIENDVTKYSRRRPQSRLSFTARPRRALALGDPTPTRTCQELQQTQTACQDQLSERAQQNQDAIPALVCYVTAVMAQSHAPGHYSGRNPIPTINQFIQNLDKDKADRDKQIDEANKAKQAAARAGHRAPQQTGDAQPHEAQKGVVKGSRKTVTDPTTGNQVVIEDVNKEMMENVTDPKVGVRCPEVFEHH